MPVQDVNNTSASTSSTSVQILQRRTGKSHRTQLILTNSSTAVITIAKTDNTVAVAGSSGIVLNPKQSYYEATDGGYTCWQGAVQAVSDIVGTVSITESFETKSV